MRELVSAAFRRRQTKARKKTKYTILDNMDEQERVELRPKFSESHCHSPPAEAVRVGLRRRSRWFMKSFHCGSVSRHLGGGPAGSLIHSAAIT